VFTKLGITSRGQLHRVLPADPDILTCGSSGTAGRDAAAGHLSRQ
jgi:hypothetical protein